MKHAHILRLWPSYQQIGSKLISLLGAQKYQELAWLEGGNWGFFEPGIAVFRPVYHITVNWRLLGIFFQEAENGSEDFVWLSLISLFLSEIATQLGWKNHVYHFLSPEPQCRLPLSRQRSSSSQFCEGRGMKIWLVRRKEVGLRSHRSWQG